MSPDVPRSVLPIADSPPSPSAHPRREGSGGDVPPIEPLRPARSCPERAHRPARRRRLRRPRRDRVSIATPTTERLAGNGLKFNRFHTTALCAPTRQALLTGLIHHTVGMAPTPSLRPSRPPDSSIRLNTWRRVQPLAERLPRRPRLPEPVHRRCRRRLRSSTFSGLRRDARRTQADPRAPDGGVRRLPRAHRPPRRTTRGLRSRISGSSRTRSSTTSSATTERVPKGRSRLVQRDDDAERRLRPRDDRVHGFEDRPVRHARGIQLLRRRLAHALDTPYQWTKQVASQWGGIRNATIVHWPGCFTRGRTCDSSSPRDRRRSHRPRSRRPPAATRHRRCRDLVRRVSPAHSCTRLRGPLVGSCHREGALRCAGPRRHLPRARLSRNSLERTLLRRSRRVGCPRICTGRTIEPRP